MTNAHDNALDVTSTPIIAAALLDFHQDRNVVILEARCMAVVNQYREPLEAIPRLLVSALSSIPAPIGLALALEVITTAYRIGLANNQMHPPVPMWNVLPRA